MNRSAIMLAIAIIVLPKSVFAHNTEAYIEPIRAITLLSTMVAAAGAFWSHLAYQRSIRPKQQFILILLALTGTLHLVVSLDGEWLLFLNGLGYYFFIFALFVPTRWLTPYRDYILLAVIIYTSVTINAYFAIHHLEHEFVFGDYMPVFGDWVGMLDKLIEVPLIWMLLMNLNEEKPAATLAERNLSISAKQ